MTARIYVGTYAKYNAGSIKGAWLDLDDYSDREAFLEAALALHSDEADPELMFQDYEGFPSGFYSEGSAPPAELWDWLALSESEQEIVDAYQHGVDQTGSIEQALEAFAGTADTEADYAENFYEETGGLEGCPEHLRYYIDWEAVARDMRGDVYFVRHNGTLYVFNSI